MNTLTSILEEGVKNMCSRNTVLRGGGGDLPSPQIQPGLQTQSNQSFPSLEADPSIKVQEMRSGDFPADRRANTSTSSQVIKPLL